jgi:hypothetical protein
MPSVRKVLIVVAVLASAGAADAWVPPPADVKLAVSRASVVFLGRVLSLRELDVRPARTLAEARVQVLECHLGAGCATGKVVRVRFLSRSVLEAVDEGFGMPVTIPLSATVLFAMARPVRMSGSIPFNVDVHRNGIDDAYVADDVPWPAKEWSDEMPRRFGSVHWPKDVENIKRAELRSWIEARRAVLSGVKRD